LYDSDALAGKRIEEDLQTKAPLNWTEQWTQFWTAFSAFTLKSLGPTAAVNVFHIGTWRNLSLQSGL